MSSARKKQSVALGCLLLIALLAGLAVRSDQLEAQVSRESMNGVYELRASARAENEAANAEAILAVTQRLEPSLGRQWRGALNIMAMPQKRIEIANTNEQIAIATGGRAAVKSPANGGVREDGAQTIKQSFDGSTLVKEISSASFGGKQLQTPVQYSTRYSLNGEGSVLSVETTVTGGLLTTPLVLHMTYDRVEQHSGTQP